MPDLEGKVRSARSTASYTVAMPPRATRASTRYRPSRTRPTSGSERVVSTRAVYGRAASGPVRRHRPVTSAEPGPNGQKAGRSARPSVGEDACAYSRRGIRPARRASRPASTAWRIAAAIRAGDWARVTADASRTAWQPSSIASAASEAVPRPRRGRPATDECSTIREMLCGLRIPRPIDGRRAHDGGAATCSRAGEDRVVAGVRQHDESVVDQLLRGVQGLERIGSRSLVVGDSSFTHDVPSARAAQPCT